LVLRLNFWVLCGTDLFKSPPLIIQDATSLLHEEFSFVRMAGNLSDVLLLLRSTINNHPSYLSDRSPVKPWHNPYYCHISNKTLKLFLWKMVYNMVNIINFFKNATDFIVIIFHLL